MSVIARENENIGKVFDELFLSRRVIKKAEGTQTPPHMEVDLPGELPDECVSTLIEMLTPSLRQHYSSRPASLASTDGRSELNPLLVEEKEISVDRSRPKAKKVVIIENSAVAMKEVFEELCLSRKRSSFTLTNGVPPSEPHAQRQIGEVPDENVSSQTLRPSIRHSPKENGASFVSDKSEETTEYDGKILRTYHSEPTVGPLKQASSSQVSVDSIFTTPSNLTSTINDDMIKTLLASPNQVDEPNDKELIETGSNTESYSRYSRKSKKRRRKSKVKHIKDTGTDTIYQTEDSTNQTEDMSSKETEEILKDRIKSETKKEQCDTTEVEITQSQEVQVDNNITVLRNKTDWTDTPFLTQGSSDNIEESTSNVDSEPTRGCPSSLQYTIQFNSADKNNSNIKTEIKRFKAILRPGKRPVEKEECEYDQQKDNKFSHLFSKPFTNNGDVKSPFEVASPDNKIQDRMFPSHNSLCSPGSTTATSFTSMRTYSCCSSYGEENLENCCCNTVLTENRPATGEPKVFWAITKINVYSDDSRTYEVMPLTGKKPAELPEKSDSVFVIIPPKLGQFVPSNF